MKKTFICPSCGSRNRVDSTETTEPIACNNCGAFFRLPKTTDSATDQNPGPPELETQIVDMRSQLDDLQDLPTFIGPSQSILPDEIETISRKKTMMLTEAVPAAETSPGTSINLESDTQSQYVAQGTILGIWGTCAIAIILLIVSIWVGFMMPSNRNARQLDEVFLSQAQFNAQHRVQQLAHAVQLTMAEARPDLSHGLIKHATRSHEQEQLLILRSDSTQAFTEEDWSTYRRITKRLCDSNYLATIPPRDLLFAKHARRALLTGQDTRLASLGDDPCDAILNAPTNEFSQRTPVCFHRTCGLLQSSTERPHRRVG